jgi:large subunit ribosomal protein L25
MGGFIKMTISKIEAVSRDAEKEKGRRLRREGYVPAVIYGHNDTTKNVKINHNEMRNLIAHHGSKAKLDVAYEDQTFQVFIKDIQKDVLTNDLLSIDFQILYQDETVRIDVPFSFHNSAEVTEYILNEDMSSIEVEALPRHLPERITVDVGDITPDKPILVRDLSIFTDENIRILVDPDDTVVSAHFKKEMVLETEEEEEAAEPEVIGESEEEEEE